MRTVANILDDLVQFETMKLPTVYIVGKELRYNDKALNEGDNRISALGDKCYSENVFAQLELQTDDVFENSPAGFLLIDI